jgi:nitrate reductase NapE
LSSGIALAKKVACPARRIVSEIETSPPEQPGRHRLTERRRELGVFSLLAFGIWPFIAVCVVGGYGFLVWMWQVIFGPPGPPG